MPPPRELNTRFQAHVRRARLVRRLSATGLCTVLLIGAGITVAKISPAAVSNATTPLANAASAATATASSFVDAVGSWIGNIFHSPTLATSATPLEHQNTQPPSQTAAAATSPEIQPQAATSSEPTTLQSKAPSPPSAPPLDDATASPLAVSKSIPSPQGRVLGASTQPPIIETAPPLSIVSPADLAALEARINLRLDNFIPDSLLSG